MAASLLLCRPGTAARRGGGVVAFGGGVGARGCGVGARAGTLRAQLNSGGHSPTLADLLAGGFPVEATMLNPGHYDRAFSH